MRIQDIHQQLAAVAPIEGVNSDGVISFKEGATDAQRAAAHAIVAGLLVTIDDRLQLPVDGVDVNAPLGLAAAQDLVRARRREALDALAGVLADAMVLGDSAVANTAYRARKALRDLPADPRLQTCASDADVAQLLHDVAEEHAHDGSVEVAAALRGLLGT